jgi:SAM-dependent methyltransferase
MSVDPASNQVQREYFTGRALPRMDPVARSSTPYTLRHVDAVLGAVAVGAEDTVLDVGCGPGKYTLAVARRGVRVEGMDLTPGLVDQLRAVAPDIPAHVGDLGDPPPALLGRFDVVIGFFVLHHIEHLDRAMAGVRALLRPGGRAAFIEPNPRFLGYYAQVTLTPGMSWRGERGILRMRSRLLRDHAERAGLGDFAVARFGAFAPALANRRGGRRVEAAIDGIPGSKRLQAFQVLLMQADPPG